MAEFILLLVLQGMSIPESDIDAESFRCMTYNIYHESRGEGELGRLAVAHLVRERVKDKRFPSTVCGVVYFSLVKGDRTECAFSWVCDIYANDIQLMLRDGTTHKSNLKSFVASATIAASALTEKSINPCKGANYYYNPRKASPRWAKIYTPKCQIGKHTFMRREKGSLL